MGIFRSDNLSSDIDRMLNEEKEWEDRLPHCDRCGEFIDDYFWDIDDEILCEDCAIDKYRRDVEGYLR